MTLETDCQLPFLDVLFTTLQTPWDVLLIGSPPSHNQTIPVLAFIGPEGSRRLRLPDSRQYAHEGGKDVSLTHRLFLCPKKYFQYSFL
jgi:hypothetical protein